MKARVMRAELRAWVATSDLGCSAEWNSADPLFVRITFTEAVKSVTWDVPREGLVTGMELHEVGDIGIRRDLDLDVVILTIVGRDGPYENMRADVSISAPALDSWLEETDRVVPIGSETREVNWDLLTRQLQIPPDVPESDLLGECRACLPGSESAKYLDMVNAPACPLCGGKLR